jgi:outer membrane murein-binding lipoprotein Lpp
MKSVMIGLGLVSFIMLSGCASETRVAALEARVGQLEDRTGSIEMVAQAALEKATVANTRIDRMWQKMMGK